MTVSILTVVLFAVVMVVCTTGGVLYAQRQTTRLAIGEIRQAFQRVLSTRRVRQRTLMQQIKDEGEDDGR